MVRVWSSGAGDGLSDGGVTRNWDNNTLPRTIVHRFRHRHGSGNLRYRVINHGRLRRRDAAGNWELGNGKWQPNFMHVRLMHVKIFLGNISFESSRHETSLSKNGRLLLKHLFASRCCGFDSS